MYMYIYSIYLRLNLLRQYKEIKVGKCYKFDSQIASVDVHIELIA